jgi:truncated hemoglobin YjbI
MRALRPHARRTGTNASEPTLFEWAGGLPALLRLTRVFYGKHVPEDPLLAPLFANMRPDHPDRVAAWLGEVFGGPSAYSERYGGYTRMVGQHLGKALTEEQRARWVQLMCKAADDAELPDDPEWRAAFVAYLEWGSRLAKENSTPGAKPPINMPCRRGGSATLIRMRAPLHSPQSNPRRSNL